MQGSKDIVVVEIPNKIEYVRFIRNLTTNIAEQMDFSEIDQYRIQVAVDEICSNSVRYAYLQGQAGMVELSFKISDDRLEINIKDSGKGFDINGLKQLDFDDFSGLTVESGRGIFMVKELMDEVQIESKIGYGTTVNMVKYRSQV